MVLADLGRKLNAALSALNRAPVVDEKVIYKPPNQNTFDISTPQLGPGCHTQGNHRSSSRIRRQRQAGRISTAKSKIKS